MCRLYVAQIVSEGARRQGYGIVRVSGGDQVRLVLEKLHQPTRILFRQIYARRLQIAKHIIAHRADPLLLGWW